MANEITTRDSTILILQDLADLRARIAWVTDNIKIVRQHLNGLRVQVERLEKLVEVGLKRR